jgi:FkbM family methyltransferase
MFKKLIWYLSSKTLPFKGKERIISLITKPSKNYYKKILRSGVYWSLYGKDLIEFSIAVRNINSNHVYNYLSEYIESRNIKVLWDIGANIGSISLPLLKKFDKLKSIMFEPNPEVCGRLIRNLHNNPTLVSRSIIMNIALLNINKFIAFYIPRNEENSGIGGIIGGNDRNIYPLTVQSDYGDQLIEKNICPIPELIKIDVEGSEYEVLEGMKNTLQKYKPSIIFENNIVRLKENSHNKDKIIKFLQSLNYTIYKLPEKKKINSHESEKIEDYIAEYKN